MVQVKHEVTGDLVSLKKFEYLPSEDYFLAMAESSQTLQVEDNIYCVTGSRHSSDDDPNLYKKGIEIKVYKKRFWILTLFSTCSLLTGLMWLQYTSTANVTICYYGVDETAVNWTSLIYMVFYLVLVFPVTWFMNAAGLRNTVLCAAFFNTLCCVTECLTLDPDGFPMVMVTQAISSVSNVLVMGVPPFLAALWFPHAENSRACAVGVFGNQFGCALGFIYMLLLLPPDCSDKAAIRYGKGIVAYSLTAVNFLIFVLVFFTFDDKPKTPPSFAQESKKDIKMTYKKSIFMLMKNVYFDLLFISFGLINGVYMSLATILNPLVLGYFPEAEKDVGWMGLVFISTGLVGSIIVGYILDFTHRFKETLLGTYIFSFLTMISFGVFLALKAAIWVQFVMIGILGFFLTSSIPIGYEYGIELTYPESEPLVAGLLISSTNIFGIIVTNMDSYFLEKRGPTSSNVFLAVVLLFGCFVTAFINREYLRTLENAKQKDCEKTTD